MPRPATRACYWDIRITPVDQEPISDWSVFEDTAREGTKVIACEEGGTAELRLHYHVYLEGLWSETLLRKVVSVLGRATPEIKGNSVYSIRKSHEGTIGYVVKGGNIVYRLNYDDKHIEEFIEASKQYKRDLETARKKETRKSQSFLQQATEHVKERLGNDQTNVHLVYREFRSFYGERPLPSRNTMELAIVQCMSPQFQEEYFTRNLSQTMSNIRYA